MPKIKVLSKREGMMSFYDMKIYLDGKILGYLPLGKSKEFDIPVGEHKIKAKLGLHESKDFSIALFNKDIRSVAISINKAGFIPILILIAVVVIAQISLPESFKEGSVYSGICSAVVVTIMVYFLFIGRKSFLKIEEGRE